MSMGERTGKRDLTYNNWHRPKSLKRFLGISRASAIAAIDIDFCEACCSCGEPLALVEVQHKPCTKEAKITTQLGRKAKIPVYSVGYDLNPTNRGTDDVPNIRRFFLRQLWPHRQDRDELLTPDQYASWLESLRIDHLLQRIDGVCQPSP